jgi:hypothetical protein
MRAGFEGAHQTGAGSLGDFAQESLQLGIGFFDGIEKPWGVDGNPLSGRVRWLIPHSGDDHARDCAAS